MHYNGIHYLSKPVFSAQTESKLSGGAAAYSTIVRENWMLFCPFMTTFK